MLELPMAFHLGAKLRRTFETYDETPSEAILRLAEELEAKFFAAEPAAQRPAKDH